MTYRVEEADLGGGIDLHVRREPIARRAFVVVVVQPVVREGSLMADAGVAPVAVDQVARKGVAGRVWRAAGLAAQQRCPGRGVEDGVLVRRTPILQSELPKTGQDSRQIRDNSPQFESKSSDLDDDMAGAGRALEGNRRVEDACTAHRTAQSQTLSVVQSRV